MRRKKMIPTKTPDTYEWTDEQKEEYLDWCLETGGNMFNAETHNPPVEKRFAAPGAWITVLRVPHVARIKLSLGETYWADHDENADKYGFLPDGQYKIHVCTLQGDLWMYPHEYTIFGTELLIKLYQEGELIFHPWNIALAQLSDQLFYVRSRGIGLAEALPLVLGTLRGPVGWFEPTAKIKALLKDAFGDGMDIGTGRL